MRQSRPPISNGHFLGGVRRAVDCVLRVSESEAVVADPGLLIGAGELEVVAHEADEEGLQHS